MTETSKRTAACSLPPPKMQAIQGNERWAAPPQVGSHNIVYVHRPQPPVRSAPIPGSQYTAWPSTQPPILHAPQQYAPQRYAPAQPATGPAQRAPPQQTHHKRTDRGSKGSWQATGEDTMHGPRSVFRKTNSEHQTRHRQQDAGHGQGQFQGRERRGSKWSRRSSGGSTVQKPSYGNARQGNWRDAKQRRFTNTNAQGNANVSNRQNTYGTTSASHTSSSPPYFSGGPRHPQHHPQPDPQPHVWGTRSTEPIRAGEDGPCRNIVKYESLNPMVYKYDPCPCWVCQDRTCSIYVDGIDDLQTMLYQKIYRLRDVFSEVGMIERIWCRDIGIYIKYETTQSALVAVLQLNNKPVPGVSSKPIRVQFRVGSQFYQPHAAPSYHGAQRDSRGQQEQHGQPSHNSTLQYFPPARAASGPQGQHGLPSQSSDYVQRNTPWAHPGFIPTNNPNVRGPSFSTDAQHARRPMNNLIPGRFVVSEPEKMHTTPPSTGYISPAVQPGGQRDGLRATVSENDQSGGSFRHFTQADTWRVIRPSDSSASSGTRGYRTPPEILEPKSGGAVARLREMVYGPGSSEGEDNSQGEIDSGTVIRGVANPPERLPSNWGVRDPNSQTQPREDQGNSNATKDGQDQNSIVSTASRDSSPEYLPALSFQPKEGRRVSRGDASKSQPSGDRDSGTRSSSSGSSNTIGRNTPLQRDPISTMQEYNGSPNRELTKENKKESTSKSGSKQNSEGGSTKTPSQDRGDETHNRERQITVVYSPRPASESAEMASNSNPNPNNVGRDTGPSTPQGAPSRAHWQPTVRQWLNANESPRESGQLSDPNAFATQFREVEAANRRVEENSRRQHSQMPFLVATTTASQSSRFPANLHNASSRPHAVTPIMATSSPPYMNGANALSKASNASNSSNASNTSQLEPFPAYTDPMASARNDNHMSGDRTRWGPHPFTQHRPFANVAPSQTTSQTPSQTSSPASSRPPPLTLGPLNPLAKEFKSASADASGNNSVAERSPIPETATTSESSTKSQQSKNGDSASQAAKGKKKKKAKKGAKNHGKNADDHASQSKAVEETARPDTSNAAPANHANGDAKKQADKPRIRPEITVAIPHDLFKRNGIGSGGKTPASSQPQPQSGNASPALPKDKEEQSKEKQTSGSPPKNEKNEQSEDKRKITKSPPESSPKNGKGEQSKDKQTSSEPAPKKQPNTQPTGSQQSQPMPARRSLGSTMPVLTSTDDTPPQAAESRPAPTNAWAQGPPRLNRDSRSSTASAPDPVSS
ncbi:hypothetical protein GGR52DRAFT_398340 [Hypoxylon sp. FL1284]|nr:hypothetical protein GGR52DRAFT_398340 [Hypoxylon sp. FL1284]